MSDEEFREGVSFVSVSSRYCQGQPESGRPSRDLCHWVRPCQHSALWVNWKFILKKIQNIKPYRPALSWVVRTLNSQGAYIKPEKSCFEEKVAFVR